MIELLDKYRNKKRIAEIRDFLEHELVISKKANGMKEETVEASLVKQLEDKFGKKYVEEQCPVGDHFKMKCDVDMFQGLCGIELKLAQSLETHADEFHRAIGQVACYAQEEYTNTCVFLLVIGKDANMSKKIEELKTIVEYLPRVEFIYRQAMNRTTK